MVVATGAVTDLAGSGSSSHQDGTGTAASFVFGSTAGGLVASGGNLFVADFSDNRIRQARHPA